MKFFNTLLALGLVAIAFISCAAATKCYSCENVKDCKKPSKVDCTPYRANQTRTYLDRHCYNVPNVSSPYYACFSDHIKSSNGEFQFKGCIYDIVDGCSYPLRPTGGGQLKRSCGQCRNKDNCNPAGRTDIDAMTVVATIAVTIFMGKYVWG